MAATNVQAFSGDVEISSNLVVNTNDLFVDTVGGNVGIGTTSPLAQLDVMTAAGGTGLYVRGDEYGANNQATHIRIGAGGGAANAHHAMITGGHTTNGSSYLSFSTIEDVSTDGYDPAERMRIDRFGNVGIGVTNPGAKLQVASAAISGTGPSHTPPLYVTGDIGEVNEGFEFRHANQTQGIGIGFAGIYATGSTPNQAISIVSRGTSSTFIKNYAVYSDDRLKTNEEYITNATDTLMKLKPQVYDKHEEINIILDNPIREAGLIAQDIYYDAPELRYLVSARNKGIDAEPVNIPQERPFIDDDPTNDPDYSGWGTASAGVAYIQLIPYLIKSNQELKLKNDALEARLDALENA